MNHKDICCNMCGKNIKVDGIQKEDCLAIVKHWGYFSEKDGERHRIYLCEKCYDLWIKSLMIPPQVEEYTEYLS